METKHDRVNFLVQQLTDGNWSAFAREIGIHPQTLQNYKKGRRPNADFSEKIHDRFSVDLNWLIAGKGEINQDWLLTREGPMCIEQNKPLPFDGNFLEDIIKTVEICLQRLEGKAPIKPTQKSKLIRHFYEEGFDSNMKRKDIDLEGQVSRILSLMVE